MIAMLTALHFPHLKSICSSCSCTLGYYCNVVLTSAHIVDITTLHCKSKTEPVRISHRSVHLNPHPPYSVGHAGPHMRHPWTSRLAASRIHPSILEVPWTQRARLARSVPKSRNSSSLACPDSRPSTDQTGVLVQTNGNGKVQKGLVGRVLVRRNCEEL